MSDQSLNTEQEILKKIEKLEKRIELISEILGIQEKEKVAAKEVVSSPPPIKEVIKTSNTSINLLPIFAVICFGFAAVFIVNLAIDSGWLTPEKQWGLLTLFGIILVSFGLFFKKIDNSYRSYVSSAGIIVLYMSAYSSSLYFDLFDPLFSQVLGGVVSVLCFYLFRLHLTEYFVVICTIGTYISPILLHEKMDLISLSGFFLLWSAVFSRISIFIRSRTLVLLGSYFSLGIFTFLNMNNSEPTDLLIIMLIQFLQFVFYAGSVYYYSIKNDEKLTHTEAMAYLPILLFFYGIIYYFFNKYDPLLAPYFSLVIAGIVFLLYTRAKREISNLESHELVHTYLAVVIFHTGYIELIPMSSKVWLLPLFILGKYVAESKNHLLVSKPLKIAFSAMAIIEFFRLCFKLMIENNLLNILPAFFTIVLGFFYYSKKSKDFKDTESLFLSLSHGLVILALYRLAYDYGSLAVSFAWGIYSVIILTVGYLNKNRAIAKSSLIVLTVTCLKALVYDAAQSPSTVRIASLILTGAVLYGAGYLFQKINNWKDS